MLKSAHVLLLFCLGFVFCTDPAEAINLKGNYSGNISYIKGRPKKGNVRCYTKSEWPTTPMSLKSVKVSGKNVTARYWNGVKWIKAQGRKTSAKSFKLKVRYKSGGWTFAYNIIVSSVRSVRAVAKLDGTTSGYSSACAYVFRGAVKRS